MLWTDDAADELVALARTGRSGAVLAGRLYEFARQLSPRRAATLPRLRPGSERPDVRWWEVDQVTIYFRADVQPMIVLAAGRTRTPQARRELEEIALARCGAETDGGEEP